MKLTEKCNTDFFKWLNQNYNETVITREGGDWGHGYEIELSIEDVFDEMPETIKDVLIISFFDEKKYFISIELVKDYTETKIIGFDSHISFDHHGELYRVNYDCLHDDLVQTRNEIISKAIIKANEIYDQKN